MHSLVLILSILWNCFLIIQRLNVYIRLGETGGKAEIEAAQFLKEFNYSRANPLPVASFITSNIAGQIKGVRIGHSSAIVEGSGTDAEPKEKALRTVGVKVVESPDFLGQARIAEFNKMK